jgi:peptidoglycan/xylan/chitin deacetylase (PgdA/CDA1 family)
MTVIPVLLYHSVSDRPARSDRHWTVSRSEFAGHIDAIMDSGREGMRITELAAALRTERPLPERPVAVTFDDGYADTYEAVESLLARGLPSTVYITTGEVGAANRLTRSDLTELARLPSVEVGAHAVQHRRLDELRDAELAHEILTSKLQLEELAQKSVHSFAYPHGAYDRRVREAVVAAGYRSAAGVKNAVSHTSDDPFAIARWTVTVGTTAPRIIEVLEGVGVPRAWAHERVRTRAYRSVRRRRRRVGLALGVRR